MTTTSEAISQVNHDQSSHDINRNPENVLRFKKRMLLWPNPVEYVNNMYGCHPDDDNNEYFKVIFAK